MPVEKKKKVFDVLAERVSTLTNYLADSIRSYRFSREQETLVPKGYPRGPLEWFASLPPAERHRIIESADSPHTGDVDELLRDYCEDW